MIFLKKWGRPSDDSPRGAVFSIFSTKEKTSGGGGQTGAHFRLAAWLAQGRAQPPEVVPGQPRPLAAAVVPYHFDSGSPCHPSARLSWLRVLADLPPLPTLVLTDSRSVNNVGLHSGFSYQRCLQITSSTPE